MIVNLSEAKERLEESLFPWSVDVVPISEETDTTREEAGQRVLEECFWGDYRFDVGELLARIDEGSDYFDSSLIGRIVDNRRRTARLEQFEVRACRL